MSVRVVYRDVDFEAKNQLTDVKINGDRNEVLMDDDLFYYCAVPPVHDATMEENYWRLDGSFDVVDELKNPNAAFCSSTLSNGANEYGYNIENSPEITYVFENGYPIRNITFSFDEEAFCTSVLIEGYGDIEQTNLLFTANAYPDDAFYNFSLDTEYNVYVLKFTFKTMNKPNRFFRLYGIDFGTAYILNDDVIYNVSILKETSAIKDSIPSGTANIEIYSERLNFDKFLKNKPVFIYKNDAIERVLFVQDTEEINDVRVDVLCIDAWGLLGQAEKVLKPFEQQSFEARSKEEGGEGTKTYISTEDFKLEGTPVKANYIDYQAPSYFSTIDEFFLSLKSVLKTKLYVSDEIKNRTIYSPYNDSASIKTEVVKLLFANQLGFIIQNNGMCLILEESLTHKKVFDSKRIFDDFNIKTNEEVTKITAQVYSTKSERRKESYDNRTVTIDSDKRNVLHFVRANFDNYARPNDYNLFVQTKAYTFTVDFSRTSNEKVKSLDVVYDLDYLSWVTKNVYVKSTNLNISENRIDVTSNEYVNSENFNTVAEALKSYYRVNKSIEFTAVLNDENIGEYAIVKTNKKRYTGIIEKLEYTMQGKKIGTVKMRIYDEENVNG